MSLDRAVMQRDLKRLFANGPLSAIPKRLSDQRLFVALAASRFEAGREYRETEVNDLLERWLGTFCEPFGFDHVTLRRMLVDARYLLRTKSGSSYRVDPVRAGEAEHVADVDPVRFLAEAQGVRASRKSQRMAPDA